MRWAGMMINFGRWDELTVISQLTRASTKFGTQRREIQSTGCSCRHNNKITLSEKCARTINTALHFFNVLAARPMTILPKNNVATTILIFFIHLCTCYLYNFYSQRAVLPLLWLVENIQIQTRLQKRSARYPRRRKGPRRTNIFITDGSGVVAVNKLLYLRKPQRRFSGFYFRHSGHLLSGRPSFS